MRQVRSIVLGAAILAGLPAMASAQQRAYHITFGGGPTFLGGGLGEKFSTGWGPALGATFEGPNHRMGFQFEYAFRRFHSENAADILGGVFTAHHDTHQMDFNIYFNLTHPDAKMRVYAVAGPGAYYRNITIDKYVGTGVICDPYWYICGSYPITSVVGTRGGWDFGFDVGGGVGFKLGDDENAEFTIESRYHFVQGPDVTVPGTPLTGPRTGNANGQYFPLTFGFRF